MILQESDEKGNGIECFKGSNIRKTTQCALQKFLATSFEVHGKNLRSALPAENVLVSANRI